ncbi:hypothetical protein [Nocardia sp. NPDC004260]
MSAVARLAGGAAHHLRGLLGRANKGLVTCYRTGSGELRNVATALPDADHRGAARIPWTRIPRPAAIVVGSGYLLAADRRDSGPDPSAEALVSMSPTLAKHLRDLKADGWTIQWGREGSGSYTSRAVKLISIDSDLKGNDLRVTAALAHEIGHAYKGAAISQVTRPRKGMTRDQWIREQLYKEFIDEAEAALVAAQIRQELIDNGGTDAEIGDTGAGVFILTVEAYEAYASGKISRQEARSQIADTIMNDPTNGHYRSYYPRLKKLSYVYFSPLGSVL